MANKTQQKIKVFKTLVHALPLNILLALKLRIKWEQVLRSTGFSSTIQN
jgi:hypothetical protein